MHKTMIKTTVNGTSIPQDPAGNDMCLLFMKFGRCRFKNKCKKSHWLPPLPDGHLPVTLLPALPDARNVARSYNMVEVVPQTPNKTEQFSQHNVPQINIQPISSIDDKTIHETPKKARFLQRRFQHIFHDDVLRRCSGFHKIVEQANVYFDVAQQKVVPVNTPKNKAEKQYLKLVKRLHWNTTQEMRQNLTILPPSYHLSFNRNKVNFTRLRPYIYMLIHECLSSDNLANKPMKPNAFEYLVADTLIAHLELKHITALEAESKLQKWGARPVRARQCIDHIWHIMAKSSNMANGCADEVVALEQKLLEGQRHTWDYAYACRHALKRTTTEKATNNESDTAKNMCASINQGLLVGKKTDVVRKKRKRSKQFKKVTVEHRKKMKSRFLEILHAEKL